MKLNSGSELRSSRSAYAAETSSIISSISCLLSDILLMSSTVLPGFTERALYSLYNETSLVLSSAKSQDFSMFLTHLSYSSLASFLRCFSAVSAAFFSSSSAFLASASAFFSSFIAYSLSVLSCSSSSLFHLKRSFLFCLSSSRRFFL